MEYLHAFLDCRAEVVREQLLAWRGAYPRLGVLAVLPEPEQDGVPELQQVARELGVPLVGAIFPALIRDGEFLSRGLWLRGFPEMPAHFLLAELAADDMAAGARISAAARDVVGDAGTGECPSLFLIFDAMVPKISTILCDVFSALATSVRYAGVNAGSESFQPMPCLFDQDRLVGNGVLGLLLVGEHAVVEHGYPVAKTLMRAISTTGNRIHLIDNRPALEVYQEIVRAEFGVRLTRENFYDYAVHYPFGVVLAAGVVVRIPVGFEEDGSIVCVGEVPPNSMLRLIRGPSPESSGCVSALARELAQSSRNVSNPLLTFYCAGRRMHLGDEANRELEMLRQETGSARLLGALSLGEIGTLEAMGMPEFHNAAIVCL